MRFEYLYLRRTPINYVAPPICEAEFSSTSFPIIVLNPIGKPGKVTGLILSFVGDRAFLSWDAYPGAICYSVYRAVDPNNPNGEYTLVAECVPNEPFEVPPGPYRVTPITPEGEGDFSDVVIVPPPGEGEPPGSGCPQTGDAVPTEFLEDITPDNIQNLNYAGGGSAQLVDIVNAPAGKYAVRWNSGTVQRLDVSECGSCAFGQFCYKGILSGNVTDITNMNDFGTWTNYLCLPTGACGGSPMCDPVANFIAAHPDQIIFSLIQDLGNEGHTLRMFVPLGGAPGCVCETGNLSFTISRVKKFIEEPIAVKIQSYLSIKDLLKPAGTLGPNGMPQWDGIISGLFSEVQFQTFLGTDSSRWIDNVEIGATVSSTNGAPWELAIFGSWTDAEGPKNQFIWTGRKFYGKTPLGNYQRDSSVNPNAPTCLVLTGV